MTIAYSQILDGNMRIPDEVLEVLPQGVDLYMRIDSEKGRVVIYAKDPTDLPNREIFEAYLEASAELALETEMEAVPEELLRRPRKHDK